MAPRSRWRWSRAPPRIASLCTRLTANLRDRGLDASKGLLFVIDGSKALSKAIRAVWGDTALIQRCRLHKERGILDHLPDAEHDWVRRKLRTAWQLTDADQAKRDLEALARALARKHPGAAGSLREGLDETLTITRLGITGTLLAGGVFDQPGRGGLSHLFLGDVSAA